MGAPADRAGLGVLDIDGAMLIPPALFVLAGLTGGWLGRKGWMRALRWGQGALALAFAGFFGLALRAPGSDGWLWMVVAMGLSLPALLGALFGGAVGRRFRR
jgi:hypothetical protein